MPYTPIGHSVHDVALPVLYCPGGHTASVRLAVPVPQLYPGGHQPEQPGVINPGVLPYTPAGHTVQLTDPAGLYCPGGHGVRLAADEPDGQVYPAGHKPLQFDAVCPSTAAYVPASQGPVQLTVDSAVLLP